ncbi:MAG TPA: hypothetical protein VL523_20150 [Terriglobia bacterium]|nr:hypothetical protein [Terriglobia bacterium]
MPFCLALLLAASSAGSIQVPRDSGLYYLTPQGLVRIEGRAVTVERSHRKVPFSGKIPLAGGNPVSAEILGAHAARQVTSTPVFFYRTPAGQESTGAGDLVLVKLRSRSKRREFTISSEPGWNASAGIPLRAQVLFNAQRVESGVFRLEPADDLGPGEYGLYLFRGRDLPGFLYDFSVPTGEKP